jgi:hypothetical protein
MWRMAGSSSATRMCAISVIRFTNAALVMARRKISNP